MSFPLISPHVPARLALVCSGLLAAALASSCEAPQPDRLALDPSGPLHFEKRGAREEFKVAAFRGPRPFVKAVPATWTTSNPDVVSVDDKGIITSTGSGRAVVTASAWGLSAHADVSVSIVGSVEVMNSLPQPLKLSGKGARLDVIVKDDKGNVIERPKLAYRATDYCVEVDDEGFVAPLADGDCDVVVSAADKSARVKLSVRE